MAKKQRKYDMEYKIQSVKLAEENEFLEEASAFIYCLSGISVLEYTHLSMGI